MAIPSIGNHRIEFSPAPARADQTVFEVQRALNQLAGRQVVPENGAFDGSTMEALRQFQKEFSGQGLQPTGVIDQRTIDVLNNTVALRTGGPGSHQAARARMWGQDVVPRLPNPHQNPGFQASRGAAMAHLERSSLAAGARADLQMNTNEAWTCMRAGGRHPVQNLDAVMGDSNVLRTAERHLNKVAQGLARDGGPQGYQSMPQDDRLKLWAMALMAGPEVGGRLMAQFDTPESRQMAQADLAEAFKVLQSANPAPESAGRLAAAFEATQAAQPMTMS